MHSVLGPHIALNHTYLMWSTYVILSQSHNQHWIELLLPRKRVPTRSTTWQLAYPWVHTQFLSQGNHWSSGGKANPLLMVGYYIYWAHNNSMWSIRLILARGRQIHRSLTDIDAGYNLGGAGFPHHTPHPSQPMVLRFPLMAMSGLRLTILNISL
jgi:hypothetical protein